MRDTSDGSRILRREFQRGLAAAFASAIGGSACQSRRVASPSVVPAQQQPAQGADASGVGVPSPQAGSEDVAAGPTSTARSATAPVPLGSAGFDVPRLAMGTGSGGWGRESDQTRLGKDAFVRLIREGAERGASFIDAADLYGSHDYVRAALGEMKREDVTLLSKVWFQEGAPNMQPTHTARPEVERFLTELGVDMIDIVLIHAVKDPKWTEQQAQMRDELSELKQRGVLRALGVSCHTHAALRVAAEDPWTEVIFARINPGHKSMDEDASVQEVADTLRLARANGKAVVGMKIYGAGAWARPDRRKESLRYALKSGLVDALTIGTLNMAQLDDTIANIEAVLAEQS